MVMKLKKRKKKRQTSNLPSSQSEFFSNRQSEFRANHSSSTFKNIKHQSKSPSFPIRGSEIHRGVSDDDFD